ncbi:MAG: 5'-deoxynucleotidase [Oscillospiraceae bacterium]|nr:5'-deoxynucleotidase [Oscillospiraceae bacterium]
MTSPYFALVFRERFINRWGLMHNVRQENVQEHSHMVASLAHALAVIGNRIYGENIDAGEAAAAALYHDAPEIYTGDMPTPVKYRNEQILGAYRQIENVFADKLLSLLPDELREDYKPLLFPSEEIEHIVKAADTLAAYIKCVEETKAGNSEFKSAMEQTRAKLEKLSMPEVKYFLENFLPAFTLTLDELQQL